ncbi:MAG: hypothetical protein KatS3mg115_2510 [Candidatus Poribacteria bacterium]|nr:MAG: hypothetical protein KatS3mg115_2510 [Candidatus Poribacteria bacterium]
MRWVGLGLVGLFLLLILILGFSACGTYNRLVEKQEQVSAQVGQLQNVLQRRADLIPNLVEVVKGYAAHEQETLTAVTQARAAATQTQVNLNDPAALQRYLQAQDQLSQALSRLMVVVERYPELKANEQFNRLMDELAGTENRIAVERRRYNELAREYNTSIRRFPAALFAQMFGFEPVPYFEAAPEAQSAPRVEFD